MTPYKLDYDEGNWTLVIDCGATEVTLHLDDTEGFELLNALKPLVERRAEYEFHKRRYEAGLRLVDPGEGYDISDPKHPKYFETFSAHADTLRKQGRGE